VWICDDDLNPEDAQGISTVIVTLYLANGTQLVGNALCSETTGPLSNLSAGDYFLRVAVNEASASQYHVELRAAV
jgi:hypothetical protein